MFESGVGIDHDRVCAVIREATERFILPRYNALETGDIREKGPGDLVTIADIEAERFLTTRLADLLPGSVVVGEEAYAGNPEILSHFTGDAPVWLVDPVDGTRNFTESNPLFCTMVALCVGNQPVMGWIHDAIRNETTSAELGAGCWRDGKRLSVPAPPEDERNWSGQIDVRYFDKPQRDPVIRAARARFGSIKSLRCAGQDFLALIEGRRHLTFYRRAWPWDHAPGVLMLREAGGMSSRIDGEAYRAGDRGHGLLCAPGEAHWHALRQFLTAM